MPDLDSIIDDARAASVPAAPASPAADPATPEQPATTPDPPKVEPAAEPAPVVDASPTPVPEPAAKPDQGPQSTVPAPVVPAPTPEGLDEAYRLAGIDPKDERAASKLVDHLRSKATPPATPEPEEPEIDTRAVLGDDLAKFVNEDRDLQQFVSAHTAEFATLQTYKGDIANINRTVAALEARLNPPKVEGVQDVEVDEFTRSDWQRRLDQAYREQTRLERLTTASIHKVEALRSQYAARVDGKADEIIKTTEARKAEKQAKQEESRLANELRSQWAASFDEVYAASGLPPEEKADAQEQVKIRARDQVRTWMDQGVDKHIEDPRAFIAGQLLRVKESYERHHVLKSRDHANAKREHAGANVPPAVPSAAHQPGAPAPLRFADKTQALDDIFENLRTGAR